MPSPTSPSWRRVPVPARRAYESEPGCAVQEAVRSGELHADRFASYQKLAAELAYEERRVDPAAARAQREQWEQVNKAMRREPDKP